MVKLCLKPLSVVRDSEGLTQGKGCAEVSRSPLTATAVVLVNFYIKWNKNLEKKKKKKTAYFHILLSFLWEAMREEITEGLVMLSQGVNNFSLF